MVLESISITRISYGEDEGRYEGRVSFVGSYGAIKVNMTPAMSKRVLEICAEEVVANAREVATTLTADCIEEIDKDVRKLT